jgi:hypothetical protein
LIQTFRLSFMAHISSLVAGSPTRDSSSDQRSLPVPSILHSTLLDWVKLIAQFTDTLTRLESALVDNTESISCLLKGNLHSKNLLGILECLSSVHEQPVEPLMQKIAGRLSAEMENDWVVKECLVHLKIAEPDIFNACSRIWDAANGYLEIPGLPVRVPDSGSMQQRGVPQAVVEVMVAGWLDDDTVATAVKIPIELLARSMLAINTNSNGVPPAVLMEAMIFWEEIEEEIVAEAERLGELRRVLKVKDPSGTTALLLELGVPDDSKLDEEMASLPTDMFDVVEKVSETEVEISFPLAAFTEMQRGAMGIPGKADCLLLRLNMDDSPDKTLCFCMHYDSEADLDNKQHVPWSSTTANSWPLVDTSRLRERFCTTTPTAFVWQLSRLIHNKLNRDYQDLADLYTFVKKSMLERGHMCISCGNWLGCPHALHLRRSTPCNLIQCSRLWYQLPLDVRIPEIRTDTFAVDAMLLAVYAAASSNRREFLPSCPIYNVDTIKTILNALPNLTVISHAVNLSKVLSSYHKDAETLISWAVVHHRGYLATATGICKIPNLPTGTHQFVLPNAGPSLESQYMSKMPKYNAKTSVLFHGTTFDRLPAILAQGLKVCSGTSLQRTGAVYGKGIYMADEPATSLSYSPTALSWRCSGLSNMRLLLGCEAIGVGDSVRTGIHLIQDEGSVMVRYLFLLPRDAVSPIANHVVSPMASAMSAMRAGAV